MLNAVMKCGRAPKADWADELLSLQKGPHLFSIPAKLPRITETDVRELAMHTGILLSEDFGKFMKWYAERSVFTDVSRCMWKSSGEWALEYIPELVALVDEVNFDMDKRLKQIVLTRFTSRSVAGFSAGIERLSGYDQPYTGPSRLRGIPPEIGTQMLELKRALAEFDFDDLKRRSWVYWSVALFNDAPQTQQRRQ